MNTIMYKLLMLKFVKHALLKPRKAVMYIAPIAVARRNHGLSELQASTYRSRVRPYLATPSQLTFDGVNYTGSQQRADAAFVTEWFETLTLSDAEKTEIHRQYNDIFNAK